MANAYEFIISLRDASTATAKKIAGGVNEIVDNVSKTSAAIGRMGGKARDAFGKVLNSARAAIKGPDTLAYSIDELEEKLKSLREVKFGTVLKSEFEEVNKEILKTEKQIERLKQGISGSGFASKMKGLL